MRHGLEEFVQKIPETLKRLEIFGQIIDLAAREICKVTTHFDRETGELKSTGARIVFIPVYDFSLLLGPMIWEMCIPAKPEKYHDFATEKAWRTIQTSAHCSAETRDAEKDQYAGGVGLSNCIGAIGLSGFTEVDDHFVLACAMRQSRLLTNSRARDNHSDIIDDWSVILDSAKKSGLSVNNDRVDAFIDIFENVAIG